MADKSKIEWTDATWNPIRGCSVVSEGCRNCYAMAVAARFSGKGQAYEGLAYRSGAHWTGNVRLIEEHLEDPLRWKRPRRIFVNSMSDLFHESVPVEWIGRIFDVMASATLECGKRHQHEDECWTGTPHTFQILTKRPERMLHVMKELLPTEVGERWAGDSAISMAIEVQWPLPNVWLGISCEDQKTASERIPLLLQTPAAVRWISAEPLLGPISLCDLTSMIGNDPIDAIGHPDPVFDLHVKPPMPLNWVVVGGESGTNARPMHPDWARSLRDQCVAAGIPFFFKQGSKNNWEDYKHFDSFPVDLQIREFPNAAR